MGSAVAGMVLSLARGNDLRDARPEVASFRPGGMTGMFRYLKVSLALVLILVGAKMLAAPWLKEALGANFNFYLLGLVFLVLAVGVAASWLVGRKAGAARNPVPGGNREKR